MISTVHEEKAFEVTETAQTERRKQPIRSCILGALDRYFKDLEGHNPGGVYRMVVGEVEKAMLERVMQYTRGNQTRASEVLGINRSTLRKKLRLYHLD